MKKIIIIVSVVIIVFVSVVVSSANSGSNGYGVFLGINSDEIDALDEYDTVVIEPKEFSEEDVSNLHNEGKTVYAYLNVGAIENYRDYYDDYKQYALKQYDTWPDEAWIDVSEDAWKELIVDKLAAEIVDKGFDGFFIDNCDVYYQYENEEIYQGLQKIFDGLSQYNLLIMINGGDTFVTRLIEEDKTYLFDSVNQETVFTSIDFENNSYGSQDKDSRDYFQDYLAEVKSYGKDVYLLEYGSNPILKLRIQSYCMRNGFNWFCASDKDLGSK